jgi:2-oxoglutarate ferredoxin oxidoreductase subunit delta
MNTTFQIKILNNFCKGCELCIGICPRHVLTLSKHVNKSGLHYPEANCQLCTGCRQCAIICPDAAIEIYKNNHEDAHNLPAMATPPACSA